MSDAPDDRPRRRRRRRRGRGGRSRVQPSTGAPETSRAPSADAPHEPGDTAAAKSARKPRPKRRRGARRAKRPAPPVAEGTTGVTPSAPASAAPETAASIQAALPAPSESPPTAATRDASRRDRAERETSAGGIVYRVQNGEPLFLLIRDSYRNWGFPKGHLEGVEQPQEAALREVQEETGLGELRLDGAIETIDWFFRFRGKLVHKVCHFYLMHTRHARTSPQREEGITACRWARFDEATKLISYANARAVLIRANDMVLAERARVATRARAAPARREDEDASHG